MKKGNRKMTVKDYLYCEDCTMFVDLWKYDSLEDSGHEECRTRNVTPEELKECVKECQENGCFEEEFL